MSARQRRANKERFLKIMIAGAPKAGNVWLKHLLADLYNLPMVDVSGLVDPRVALEGDRFITHQHIRPRRDFLGWGAREGVQFITMSRHPGDLFLSLFHYVQNYGEAWRKAGILGQAPSHGLLGEPLDGQAVFNYLAGPFFEECLQKTCQWLQSGEAIFVRYEDLHENGQFILEGLAEKLEPASPENIAKTISKHSFQRMKRFAGRKMKRHFRTGKVGDWAPQLNERHLTAIRESHGSALDILGYSLDPELVPSQPEPESSSIWQKLF